MVLRDGCVEEGIVGDALSQLVGHTANDIAAIAVACKDAALERLKLDQPNDVFNMRGKRDLGRD